MKLRYLSMIGTVSAFAATSALLVPLTAPALSAEVEANEDDVQVLTRGPVHEAFAESVSSQPEPGMIVEKAPPEAIEELPPEQQLEGDNVTWISGYWAWDDDQADFLWISGIWRNLPPGRQWVPGYWTALDDGRYQWTSGYWADSEESEVAYIPQAPPASVDSGPNVEAPSEDHTWIPGNWVYGESRYAWRPGYWTPLRQNWTWVPSRYCWSPRGYIYVDGYWDHAVASRGTLFAPVYYRRPVWSDPGYYYTPSVVVSLSVFSDHLFYRPRACHYYFGDYYAPRYSPLGFFASHSWHSRRGCFDPIYNYNRWHHRHDRDWDHRQRERFDFFRNNEEARPLHNWAAMRDFRGDRFSNDERGRNRQFASSLAGFANNPAGGQRFRNLGKEDRQRFVAQNREVRNFGQQRRQLETRKVAAGEGAGKMALREKLNRSPLVGRQAERLAKGEAPPKRLEARGSNVRLNPKQQQPGIARNGDAAARNGRQGALAQRDANGNPAAKGQARENRKPILPGAANRSIERDPAAKGQGQARANRDTTPKPQARQLPGRKADVTPQRQAARELPGRKPQAATQQRQAQPKPQVRETPQRKQQVTPQRQAQPKAQSRDIPQRRPQAAPQRQVQPKQQVRPNVQRREQAAPQRQAQRPQVRQAAPQRQAQPRPQARQAPQQRQAQRPQVRQAAPQQRQAQRPQVRQAAPQQRQVQPRQQQARPQPQPRQQRQAPQQREERKKNRADA